MSQSCTTQKIYTEELSSFPQKNEYSHRFLVQFSSVAQSCPTLYDPMNHSKPGLPVHHQLPESTQTHAHESVTPSNHLILSHLLLLLPSIFPSIRVFSNESALCIRWPKYLKCQQIFQLSYEDFPHNSLGKESTCNAGDPSLIPGLGRFPWRRERLPLQYSGLENSMDCIVHGVSKSQNMTGHN